MGRQQDNADMRVLAQNTLNGLNTVQVRHIEVHYDNIGPQPQRHLDRHAAIFRLADYSKIGNLAQLLSQQSADQRRVVRNQYVDVRHHPVGTRFLVWPVCDYRYACLNIMDPSALPDTDQTIAPVTPPSNPRIRGGRPATQRVPGPQLWGVRPPADWRRRSLEGFLLGALLGLCVSTLGISELLHLEIQEDIVLLPGLAGTLLALSPARRLLRIASCAILAVVILVGYTPLMSRLMPPLVRADALERVPAIVVISTALRKDNTLNAAGQERFVHGYLLLKQGWSGTLVLTRAIPKIGDQSPVVMAQMRTLGLDFPVERVGPVFNTHDEAVLAAQLARMRGWKRVILVTHPWHMRRARAVFLKAGLDVLCSPCVEGSYDMSDLGTPRGRFAACNNWLHETVGFQIYRLRGWL